MVAPSRLNSAWQKYGSWLIVILLAIGIIVTITGNWNSLEDGRVEQITNGAYIRGDLTPLSTRVPGLLREVKGNDFQQVHKDNTLVQFDDVITKPRSHRLLRKSKLPGNCLPPARKLGECLHNSYNKAYLPPQADAAAAQEFEAQTLCCNPARIRSCRG